MAAQYTVIVHDKHGAPKRDVSVQLTIDKLHWDRKTTNAEGKATFSFDHALTVIELRVDGKLKRSMFPVAGTKEEIVKV